MKHYVDKNALQEFATKFNAKIKTIFNGLFATKNELEVERNRITNLATLTDGSTTGDAELIDIRTGADGKIYTNAGEAVRGQIGNLKSDLDVIYAPVSMKWERKAGNAEGTFNVGNSAKSQILSGVKSAYISDGAKSALFLYKNGVYIGKMNANYVMDKVAGSWGFYNGFIDLESIMTSNGADGIVLNVSPTDGTVLTDADVQTFGDSHTSVKRSIALTEENTTKPISTTWVKGLLGADGILYSANNGVTSDFLQNIDLIEFKNGVEGGISLFFYKNGVYIGKISANGTINKTGGDWRKLYTVVNVREIMSSLDIDADAIRFSYSPTDGTVITNENAQTWGSANVTIYASQFATEKYVENITDDLKYEPSIFMTINHRGYSLIAPENTLPAYVQSKRHGFKWVECDIEWTSDNVPVLLHDSTINRTGRNADGTNISSTINISDITYEQALSYDFGIWKGAEYSGTKIPTLQEFLLLCKNLSLNCALDIKNLLTTEQREIVATAVKEVGMGENIAFMSSNWAELEALGQLFPKAMLNFGILAYSATDAYVETAIQVCTAIRTNINKVTFSIYYLALTQAQYDMLTNEGINVIVWKDSSDFTESEVLAFNKAVIGAFCDGINAGRVIMDNTMNQY